MGLPDAGRIEEIDSLYICGLPNDVLRGCRASLARDRAEGARIALVSLFDPPPPETAAALEAHGVTVLALGLPASRHRHPHRRPIDGFAAEPAAADDECREQASQMLHDLGHRTRARQVQAPLGVGGHPDRRLAHEAARGAFRSGGGRDVFFYEERPESLLRGAVRVRLAQIGARLPPAAIDSADSAPLLPFLLRFHVGPSSRGEIEGGRERLRSLPLAARFWREGRSWQPQRARGPRLQPVVWEPAGDGLPVPASGDAHTDALAAAYGRRLRAGAQAERYWLLLPPLAGDGWEDLPLASGE
jgi:LmbE family N-acetylglucosaminyl deacetylase